MKHFLNDIGILILRLVAGGTMLLAHGWGKLTGFSEKMDFFPDPLGVGSSLSLGMAIFAEVGCALLIVLGIATRLASIPLWITMAVAFFVVHSDDPFGKKELAFAYLAMYSVLICLGGGKLSLSKAKKFPFD